MKWAWLLLLVWSGAWGATQYVCTDARGSGDGTSLPNCKAAGTDFASITVGAGDVIRVCELIRGALTVTSTNNVTIDIDCNDEAAGEISGADVVTAFDPADGAGEYGTTATFTLPTFVMVDGTAWKEGVKGSLADNEWAFSSSKVFLGSDPTGRTVEVAIRGRGIEFITSTGVYVTGGRIEGVRHTGSANGNAGVIFRASSGIVEDVDFYAVRRPTDVTGNGSMTVIETRTNYCADGPDANLNVDAPSLTIIDSEVYDCGWNGWFDNTATSHSLTIDREGMACTNCTSLTIRGGIVKRVNQGLAWRVSAPATIAISQVWVEDTIDDGVNGGCLTTGGIPTARISSNIFRHIGSGGGYGTGSYALAPGIGACGSGGTWELSHNSIADSAGGWILGGAASQTGTIRVVDNTAVNINHENVSGTHYFANWNSVNASHALTIVTNTNRYYQTDGVGFFRWIAPNIARAYSAFATYQSDSSQEAASTLGDPLWVAGLSPDSPSGFRLTCASPLRNAGTDVGRIQDYGNRLFRIGTPSIGAWEHAEGDERCTITERTTPTARTTVTPRTTITPR